MPKSQFHKIDPYDWFCGPGSQILDMLSVCSGCVCMRAALTGRAGPGSDHAGSVRSGCCGWWRAARAQASGGHQTRSSCKPTPRLGQHREERWDTTTEQQHPTNPELHTTTTHPYHTAPYQKRQHLNFLQKKASFYEKRYILFPTIYKSSYL